MARAKQYADRVNVIKRIKVNGKWPFAPVVERSGRIVRDHVWVLGREERHPEGRYYLEWYQGGKRRRQAIASFDQVTDAARKKSIELDALGAGILPSAEVPAVLAPARRTIVAAIEDYLDYVKKQRSLRTYRTYRPTLSVVLRNSYTKTYVDEATRDDILKFMSDCFDLGLGARTVYDKLVVVLQFFKRNGQTGLVETNDWPEYVDTVRPVYEQHLFGPKAGALRHHHHSAVRWGNQCEDEVVLLDGEDDGLLFPLADALDLDQLHRIPLPLDDFPQHGLLIQPVHERLDVAFSLGCGIHLLQPFLDPERLSSEEYNALLVDVTRWLEQARKQAGRAVNALMTTTYWRIGERIFEQEQRGGERVGYGERIVEQLARDLSARFDRGFSRANVFQMHQLYHTYRAKVQTASGLFDVPFPLSWSHYVRLLTVTEMPPATTIRFP